MCQVDSQKVKNVVRKLSWIQSVQLDLFELEFLKNQQCSSSPFFMAFSSKNFSFYLRAKALWPSSSFQSLRSKVACVTAQAHFPTLIETCPPRALFSPPSVQSDHWQEVRDKKVGSGSERQVCKGSPAVRIDSGVCRYQHDWLFRPRDFTADSFISLSHLQKELNELKKINAVLQL